MGTRFLREPETTISSFRPGSKGRYITSTVQPSESECHLPLSELLEVAAVGMSWAVDQFTLGFFVGGFCWGWKNLPSYIGIFIKSQSKVPLYPASIMECHKSYLMLIVCWSPARKPVEVGSDCPIVLRVSKTSGKGGCCSHVQVMS